MRLSSSPSPPHSNPTEPRRKHKFAFDNFKSNDFLRWETGEVCELKVGVNRKVRNKNEYALRWKKLKVPLIYVQLVAQLVAEDLHGGHNTGHEALRRQSYARRLLDHVGNEFRTEFNKWKKFFKPCDIRFKTLNPVLQRYFRGVPDGYTPSVRSAISGSDRPTIRDVTMFYLAVDPCDPDLVPCYRRNLLYIPESRWHLAVILGIARLDSVEHFDRVRVNHDNIMEELALEGATDTADGEESKLNEVEVRAILDEGLEDFFKDQLNRVVHIPLAPCCTQPLTLCLLQLEIVEQVKAQRAEEAEQDEEQDELEPMEV